ncbi:MAG TPA: c-type cytochrome [Thermodesulfobacteriota bacterium]
MRDAKRLIVVLAAALVVAGCQKGGETPAPSAVASPESGAPAPSVAKAGDPRGQIFIDKGCVMCHQVSKLGVPGQEIGPDLSFAASDVRARFGTDLESFLKNPTGTMQIVLSSQITLSEDEREDIAELLIELEKDHDSDRKDRKDRK